jgi:hypothetical protein
VLEAFPFLSRVSSLLTSSFGHLLSTNYYIDGRHGNIKKQTIPILLHDKIRSRLNDASVSISNDDLPTSPSLQSTVCVQRDPYHCRYHWPEATMKRWRVFFSLWSTVHRPPTLPSSHLQRTSNFKDSQLLARHKTVLASSDIPNGTNIFHQQCTKYSNSGIVHCLPCNLVMIRCAGLLFLRISPSQLGLAFYSP